MPFPELLHFRDTDVNDQSKTVFTVPNGEVYKVLYVFVVYEAAVAAANRQLVLMVSDPDTYPMLIVQMGDYITTGEKWYVTFAPGVPLQEDETSSERTACVPIPAELLVQPGCILTVLANSPNAGDDMTVHAVVERKQPGLP